MDKTSLNPKHGMKGVISFQSVLAHDLEYWNPFSMQVALMKHIFKIEIYNHASKLEQLIHQMAFCI